MLGLRTLCNSDHGCVVRTYELWNLATIYVSRILCAGGAELESKNCGDGVALCEVRSRYRWGANRSKGLPRF